MPDDIRVTVPVTSEFSSVLTPEALRFAAKLERDFGPRRRELLLKRAERQAELDACRLPEFLAATKPIRNDVQWRVAQVPRDLERRHVEITGPTDRKMMINALNSGADVFMADFEDSNSPTWTNMVEGHINLRDAIDRTIVFSAPDKVYRLHDETATLMVRPRGWHLEERHVLVDDRPITAAFFDFGLYFFHNARRLLERGTAPYFYLPKLESHLEARLWNDVFQAAQDELAIPRGTIRATVLIETILAAFEMDEILYELRDHVAGLNAGRWDYIFSIIKKFRNRPDFVFPDRAQVTMTVPFMRAYALALIQTCHRRGAHAIGGMAAFIPSRKDARVNETALSKVREDKLRESTDGFDGTWVAHPDLVPVAKATFHDQLGDKPHQKERTREDVHVSAGDLVDLNLPDGSVTEAGLRTNINVALQYLQSWLRGYGAAGIYDLMEDVATAEISRAQVWQWIQRRATLEDGRRITTELVRQFIPEELESIRRLVGQHAFAAGKFEASRQIFDRLVTGADFVEFLTLIAYDYLD